MCAGEDIHVEAGALKSIFCLSLFIELITLLFILSVHN